MSSRRMKMKVAVNVGRSGRPGRPGPDTGTPTNERVRPMTPLGTSNDGDSTDSTVALAIASDSIPMTSPKSPVKHFSSLYFPSSPIKSTHPITSPSPTRRTLSVSESEAEDDPNVFHEEEVFSLVPVSPRDSGIASSPRSRSSSPIKHPNSSTSTELVALSDEFRRGPGTGPPIQPSTNSHILNNIQKEIGPVHVSHVSSNDTLRQRLQKGTGSLNSKYSILRKEFLASTKNKKPDKKDLTILHFTFFNPPGDEEPKKSDVDSLYEGIVTSVMKIAQFNNPPSPPPPVVDLEPEKKSVGPRVKVGPDGELIIDEQSLVVETSESVRAKKQLQDMETVMAATSGYYRHKRIPKRGYDWTVKETVRFFKALTMCGTDFSMMAHLFPNRSRAELKAKFKREDRKNSHLVSQALAFQTFDPMEPMTDSEESEDEDFPSRKRRRLPNSNCAKSKPPGEIKEIEITKNSTELVPMRRKSIEMISENDPAPTSTPLLAIEYHPTTKPPVELPKSIKKIKKKAIKVEKVSTLPDFVPGRPMGIGDCSKLKKVFKREKKKKKKPVECDDESSTVQKKTKTEKAEVKRSKATKKEKDKTSEIKLPPKKRKTKGTVASNPESETSSAQAQDNPVPESARQASPDPRLEILRFDADDPLGLKVVQGQAQTLAQGPRAMTPQEEAIVQVIHRVLSTDYPEEPSSTNCDAEGHNTQSDTEENRQSSLRKSPPPTPPPPTAPPPPLTRERNPVKVKVKPRIPRVPGGGGPVPRAASESQVQGGDEIEIEISCL